MLDENENPFTVLSVGREVVVRFNVNQDLDTLKQTRNHEKFPNLIVRDGSCLVNLGEGAW